MLDLREIEPHVAVRFENRQFGQQFRATINVIPAAVQSVRHRNSVQAARWEAAQLELADCKTS